MPLAGLESTTGTTIAVVAAEPATYDLAGFEALTFVPVVGVVTFGSWGDENEDVNEPLLAEGRVIHTVGTADGGSVEISVQHRTTDAGSDILRANGGTNTLVSIKKTYASGDAEYGVAVISAAKFREASSNSVRGYTCMAMLNSGILEATAAEIAALP
ncbi:MAG: hypothetical protein ACPG61_07265 [Paracoccaceae bacterium]